MKKNIIFSIAIACLTLFVLPIRSTAQGAKQVNRQSQAWVSINSTIKFNSKWGMVADAHIRRTNFVADPNFYFLRAGASYWINPHFNAILGYAHMWLANPVKDAFVYTNENRLYEQFQYNNKWAKGAFNLRLRNEHRWQEKMSNGLKTNDSRYTDRVRLLAGINYRIFKNEHLPRLLLVDEIAVHFGKEVIYNTFDQNRLTLGIYQKLSKTLAFDLGYMMVYQQKYSGYQYDLNNTLRLFFYYTPDFSHHQQP